MSKTYDQFSPPPKDYKGEHSDGAGRPVVLCMLKHECYPHTLNIDHVIREWDRILWWCELPPTPVKPRRFTVEPMNNCNGPFTVSDKEKRETVSYYCNTRETAQAIADLYEASHV